MLPPSSRRFRHLPWLGLGLLLSAIALPAAALVISVSPDGIDALRLHQPPYNLTGRKIAVGQVEIGRPSRFGLDKIGRGGSPVDPAGLFLQDGPASANQQVDRHAAHVASVMISRDKLLTGVAPDARLFAAAVGFIRGGGGQPQECLASQHVALQNGGDVRAMNFSFGESLTRDPRPDAVLDGNALLTQCIDWSSRVHNLLYVIAGNQGQGGIPIPTDNFNGINVASSTQRDGQFTQLDPSNMGSEPTRAPIRGTRPESNLGPRRSINLVAPGSGIQLIEPDGRPTRRRGSGTSFAAPHVVATIALLQEYGDRNLHQNTPNWPLASRHPMVMKAVLLNSADKLKDNGDGLHLGMARTLLDNQGQDWRAGDAYTDRTRPLHADLGTGHLNAYRAYQQFSAGFADPDDPAPIHWSAGHAEASHGLVPPIGWHYSSLTTANNQPSSYRDYVLDRPLQGGSYLSATLTWERQVDLLPSASGRSTLGDTPLYAIGDAFTAQRLNNLDLYLLPAESDRLSDNIWSSVSAVDSVEHLFVQLPATGRYKLRVVYRQQMTPEAEQPYAIAWWGAPAPE